ncbi:signal protein [Frankia sp. Cpl3]|nr:signal protein [Frankia sp. Cpl3]
MPQAVRRRSSGRGAVSVSARRWAPPAVVAVLAAVPLAGSCAPAGGDGLSTGTAPEALAPATSPTERLVESPVEERALAPADLQSRWWTWAASAVGADNPVEDPDGHACAVGQPTDVWFLAGTFGGYTARQCVLPTERPVVVPLVNLVAQDPADCTALMADAAGGAELDGSPLQAEAFPPTSITYRGVAGNPVTGDAGTFQGYGCGLWVQLPPLAPGQHTLSVRGSSLDFATSVDYLLVVSDPAADDRRGGGDHAGAGGTVTA